MTESRLLSEVNFILFTKDSCGPCGLVKRYFNAMKDERTQVIQEVHLEDFSDEPIPEENLALAKKYGCLLYTSPSPRDRQKSRMPSSA